MVGGASHTPEPLTSMTRATRHPTGSPLPRAGEGLGVRERRALRPRPHAHGRAVVGSDVGSLNEREESRKIQVREGFCRRLGGLT